MTSVRGGETRPGLVLGVRREGRRHPRFTNVELFIVETIIGILMAIAIPTFIGAPTGANGRAARTQGDEPVQPVVAHDAEAFEPATARFDPWQ